MPYTIEGETIPDLDPESEELPTHVQLQTPPAAPKKKETPEEALQRKLATRAPPERIYLKRPEVAVMLGISRKTLDARGCKTYHELPYSLIGGRALYRLSDVIAYIERRRKGGADNG